MNCWYIGVSFLVITVLIIQSIEIYKVHNSNMKILGVPQSNKGSKEWNDFIDLFKEMKIHEGFVRVLVNRDEDEEVMLHFNSSGWSHDYHKNKYILVKVSFEYDGYDKDDPARFGSYDLYMDQVVNIGKIEEGGYYGNYDINYHVDCLLKDGRIVQLIFEREEESANGNR